MSRLSRNRGWLGTACAGSDRRTGRAASDPGARHGRNLPFSLM